jgi:hypothetical protein
LNGEEREEQNRNRMRIGSDGQAVEPPTQDEVKQAIRQLKNGKAAGKDGLPAELLKAGSERLYDAIHRIILRIWEDEEMPEDWLNGLICPIYKKGNRLDCSNYRGITAEHSIQGALPYSVLQIEAVDGGVCWRIPSWFSSWPLHDGSNVYPATDPR